MNTKSQDTSILDTPLFQNYVSPQYCSDLMYAGLNIETKYFWRIYPNGETLLDTYQFDIDSYYVDGMKMLDKIKPCKKLPAYSIKDIEKRLPDYCICRVNREYEISIDENYFKEPLKDSRLPDALARMYLNIMTKTEHMRTK